jgi:SET domain-containing protein
MSSPRYRFCFSQPSIDLILDLQRKRAAATAEQALENSSGCARTEGIKAVARSGGSGRITRALVRSADEEVDSSSNAVAKKGEEKAKADKNSTQVKYRRMNAVPIEQRLAVRRSHIHGWGLFTKQDIVKDYPIVEYMGEVIRQSLADKRERAYEISGEGSCYMFRLDLQRIVDATMIGCMARFMNHSCQPNAYAKIINVDTDLGQDKKIVVFANRNIVSGDEITYGEFVG